MIQVCTSLHNYILKNQEDEDLPVVLNDEEEEESNEANEEENEEFDQLFPEMSTSEKIMWMIEWGQI